MKEEEEENIISVLPTLVDQMSLQGELLDRDFDNANIKSTTKKDHLVYNRRRSIILTSKTYIQNELDKARQRNDKTVNSTRKRKYTKKPKENIEDQLSLKRPYLRTQSSRSDQ
jgi:hypothetical protein